MNVSIKAKSMLTHALFFGGYFIQKLQKFSGNKVFVLTYHRVLPEQKGRRTLQPGMYVTPETLDMHLQFLQGHFTVISQSEIPDVIGAGATGEDENPFCAVTFDDGWKDFHEFAFPVIKRYKLPVTVFLSIDFMDDPGMCFGDRFAVYMSDLSRETRKRLAVRKASNPIIRRIEALKGTPEDRHEETMNMIKAFSSEEKHALFDEIRERWNVRDPETERSFLNWDEIREMFCEKFITYGSHAKTHVSLNSLPPEEVKKELDISKRRLIDEGVVDPDCISICYPFGDYTDDIVELARETGYSMGFTADKGYNSGKDDLLKMKRISIHDDMANTEPMFGCRILGII